MSTRNLQIGERLLLSWRGRKDAHRLGFYYHPSGIPISKETDAEAKAEKLCSVFICTQIRAMEAQMRYAITKQRYRIYLKMNSDTKKRWYYISFGDALAELNRQIGILDHKVASGLYLEITNVYTAERKKEAMDQQGAEHYANVYAQKILEARLALNNQFVEMNDEIAELLCEKIRLLECAQTKIASLRARCYMRIFYYYDKAAVECAKRYRNKNLKIHGSAVDEVLLDEITDDSVPVALVDEIEVSQKKLEELKRKIIKLLPNSQQELSDKQ